MLAEHTNVPFCITVFCGFSSFLLACHITPLDSLLQLCSPAMTQSLTDFTLSYTDPRMADVSNPALREAVADVRNDNTATDWFVSFLRLTDAR